MCSTNGKKNRGAGCGETGMECYKMRLERQAMIGGSKVDSETAICSMLQEGRQY